MPHIDSALQAMTDLADFVATRTKAGAARPLAEAVEELSEVLQALQWQTAMLVERGFWSLCKGLQPAAQAPGRPSSSKARLWDPACNLSLHRH